MNANIGRSTWFGNPYRIGQLCGRCMKFHHTAGDTLSCYEKYLRERLRDDWTFAAAFSKLMASDVGLYCPGCGIGSSTCHGRIMEKLWKEENSMHQTNTSKPGKSTSRSIKDLSDAEKRDARITTAGLLNHIIAANYEANEWAELLIHALRVHQYGTRRALSLHSKRPIWREGTDGNTKGSGRASKETGG